MVEATLSEQLESFQPGVDVVVLTASDAETWASRLLGTVKAAVLSLNADTDGDTNVTISGNVVTMNLAGVTDDKVTLTMWGTH